MTVATLDAVRTEVVADVIRLYVSLDEEGRRRLAKRLRQDADAVEQRQSGGAA